MSGRHRHGGPSITQRALAGTVPVLGVAGAVTGLVLSSGAAAPPPPDAATPADDATAPTAAETTAAPSVRTAVPGRAEQAVSAVAAATDAAREQDALARSRDQRSVTAVVHEIRAEAERRDAVTRQEGRTELEAFREQQAQDRARDLPGPDGLPSSPVAGSDPSADCEVSGLPHPSPFADSDEIVDRDCGMTDDRGRDPVQDSWIEGQMLSSGLDEQS